MQRLLRIGVFLHDSPADDEALAYAGRFAELADSESVLCVHVRESDEAHAPEPDAAAYQQQVLAQLPPQIAARTKVELRKDAGIPAILRSARDTELDLLVVGRRLPSEQVGIGSAFARLARKAPCSVLVVPNYSRGHLARMLVPVDFSDHSKLALEQALGIARAGGANPQAVVHHVATVGYGHHMTGLNLYEATNQMQTVGQEQLDKFLAGVDTAGVALEQVCTCSERVEQAILDMAAAHKADLIVVGSHGRGWTAATLLGSTTERVLVNAAMPVLVVKQKGETTHLLNALLGES